MQLVEKKKSVPDGCIQENFETLESAKKCKKQVQLYAKWFHSIKYQSQRHYIFNFTLYEQSKKI